MKWQLLLGDGRILNTYKIIYFPELKGNSHYGTAAFKWADFIPEVFIQCLKRLSFLLIRSNPAYWLMLRAEANRPSLGTTTWTIPEGRCLASLVHPPRQLGIPWRYKRQRAKEVEGRWDSTSHRSLFSHRCLTSKHPPPRTLVSQAFMCPSHPLDFIQTTARLLKTPGLFFPHRQVSLSKSKSVSLSHMALYTILYLSDLSSPPSCQSQESREFYQSVHCM